MSGSTTIKVPRALRDRLARRAEREHVPLAQVIERALDENEDREFWARVHRENAQLSTSERQVYVGGSTLGDDLDDAGDDALSERGEW
ncbi:putative transcriptional regulator [Agromyces albus]|nr:putative transcriptional regulator [Agromyces albus]